MIRSSFVEVTAVMLFCPSVKILIYSLLMEIPYENPDMAE
jgi:hypothetical protein